MRYGLWGLIVLVGLLGGCPGAGSGVVDLTFDFSQGDEGWEAGVADYSPDNEIEFETDVRELPAELDPEGTGLFISGRNSSDDLFLFLTREVGPADGVQANQAYEVSFTIVFASNAPSGCAGVGGAPGEGVTLKAGATATQPQVVLDQDFYSLNVDKGQQTIGGPAASVVGDIANGIECEAALEQGSPYVSLTRNHAHDTTVTADATGRLWLLVGTDSGFEATTALYYQRIDVTLTAVAE
ncbi:MAG TPA: hypothetical protein PKK06_13630 [Phycisphaerae bacterium]|nr:hypothetical protein [Phycisphaerae bacterium]HNU46126.1 hypothetical protein [Phycisphaerae bacterium]